MDNRFKLSPDLERLMRNVPLPSSPTSTPAPTDLAALLDQLIGQVVDQRVKQALDQREAAEQAAAKLMRKYAPEPRQPGAMGQPGQDHLQPPSGGWAPDDADPLDRQRHDPGRPSQPSMDTGQQTAFLGDMRREPSTAESMVSKRNEVGDVVEVTTIYDPPARNGIAKAITTIAGRDETGRPTKTRTSYYRADGTPC